MAAALPVMLAAAMQARPQKPGPANGYVGALRCAACHEDKGSRHAASPHGNTWKPPAALDGMPGLPQGIREGDVSHRVEKGESGWTYTVQLPGRPAQTVPVHSIMGGARFGISFILQVEEIESRPLARPTLSEARFMLEADTRRLKLSPGFPAAVPEDYDLALGRILSPQFADKCLTCHSGPIDGQAARRGEPRSPFADTAVGCERCHGPGAAHVTAAENREADLKIVHPGRLSNAELMEICGQCHTGFFPLVEPRPDDVLVAAQVVAMTSSECFIQSDGGFSCLSCHDPHEAARPDDPGYVATCLNCHSERMGGVTCPVNAVSDCISCHMPTPELPGSFHLTDHWIRVVSE